MGDLFVSGVSRDREGRAKLRLIKQRKSPAPIAPTLSDKLLAIRRIGWMVPSPSELRLRDRKYGDFFNTARGFVVKCARWFYGDDLPIEDVLQEAHLAMWRAMLDWDEARAPFDTHARWRIRTALGGMLRASRLVRGKKPESFEWAHSELDVMSESESALDKLLREEKATRSRFTPRGTKRQC